MSNGHDEYEMSIVGAGCSFEEVEDFPPIQTIDPQYLITQAARFESAIDSINVIESSNITFGPTFYSVSQNVCNIEVSTSPVLGVELVPRENSKRIRCSMAVFVCWALVVAVVLISFCIYFAVNKPPSRLDLDIEGPWYIRRKQWHAKPELGITLLKLPVSIAAVGHSVGNSCTEKRDCIDEVLKIQTLHQKDDWNDIGPNFLVGGNGFVFEGRGANILGAMIADFNGKIISIMFLGDYTKDLPKVNQFDHLNILLKELVRKRILAEDYTLLGHCQIVGEIVTPGPNIVDNLHRLDHWNPVNKSICLRS